MKKIMALVALVMGFSATKAAAQQLVTYPAPQGVICLVKMLLFNRIKITHYSL